MRTKDIEKDLIRTIRRTRMFMKTELLIQLKEDNIPHDEIEALIHLFDLTTDKLIAEGTRE